MRMEEHDPQVAPVRGNGRREGVWTVIEMVRWSGEYLQGKGVVRGRLDSEYLLGHVLGVSRLQLYLQFDRPLATGQLNDAQQPEGERAHERVLFRQLFQREAAQLDGARQLSPKPGHQATQSGHLTGDNLAALLRIP